MRSRIACLVAATLALTLLSATAFAANEVKERLTIFLMQYVKR